ncbi:hypothetical protein Nepgr_021713 [Nepenthes gracilis]|uniref:Uncharacterized protein n=1 Tax=Nepenthes gracilis TaxID=150966 RepID=A0AAD3XW58_NEPGR|nr:hypothetical protein Nepgr_021713 [Nepenthes gracilis]
MLKRGSGYFLAETMQTPRNVSPRPLKDLAKLEASCGVPKTNNSDKDLLILRESVAAMDSSVYAGADPSTPPGDVQVKLLVFATACFLVDFLMLRTADFALISICLLSWPLLLLVWNSYLEVDFTVAAVDDFEFWPFASVSHRLSWWLFWTGMVLGSHSCQMPLQINGSFNGCSHGILLPSLKDNALDAIVAMTLLEAAPCCPFGPRFVLLACGSQWKMAAGVLCRKGPWVA